MSTPEDDTARRVPVTIPVRTDRVVLVGIGLWVVALALTLAVPALHDGDRSWWPWCAAAGIVLGVIGWAYVRPGRDRAETATAATDQHRYY